MPVFDLLAAAFGAFMLVRHGPRALLFAAPSLLRPSAAPPEPARSPAEQRARDQLEALGFEEAATLSWRGPLGSVRERHAVLALASEGVFADVASGRSDAPVRFVSACPDGAVLLTSNERRAAIEGRHGRAAGLVGAALDATLAAHRKGLERFARAHGTPSARAEPGSRLAAARAWAVGVGRSDVRRATVIHFVNALLAVAILAAGVKGAVRTITT
jgi:hypothetical protein